MNDLSPLSVLLVGHDPQSAYLLQRYAQSSGCQFTWLKPDEDVITLARQAQPTVIILDVPLPTDGLDATIKALASEPATCHIPIYLFVSSEAVCNAEEVDAVIIKPVVYDDFLNIIAEVKANSRFQGADDDSAAN
jgi:CheY-like chemotaxis protein